VGLFASRYFLEHDFCCSEFTLPIKNAPQLESV
jgi:hypothetical protein